MIFKVWVDLPKDKLKLNLGTLDTAFFDSICSNDNDNGDNEQLIMNNDDYYCSILLFVIMLWPRFFPFKSHALEKRDTVLC